jgi:16S rRNA (uracil1498-N3)-methyltransferase
MRRFFVDRSNINGSRTFLTGSDAKHIQQVLRLAPGDSILLFDGSGNEYESIIEKILHNKISVALKEKKLSRSESPIQLIAAQAILKDRKMDTLLRQLTELGVTKWIPFSAERSVPRPDANRMDKRIQRWKKIAKESLKQCKRGFLPEIDIYRTFENTMDDTEECDLKIIFHQDAQDSMEPLIIDTVRDTAEKKIFLMFGPEGGFTQDEVDMALGRGFKAVRIGPRVLRAETAPVAACAIVQYIFGDMGSNSS